LNDVRDSPSDIVRTLVECHAIASPESDQSTQLVAELGDCANETATEFSRGTFCDVQIGRDVDTSKAKPCEQAAKEQDTVGIWDDLDSPILGST
jgi:hypothetical protein